VATTLPCVPNLYGIVNDSSVGMFGLNTTPLPAFSLPPAHTWSSINSTTKSVPKLFVKCNDLKFASFNNLLFLDKYLLCSTQSATGSLASNTRHALNIASQSFSIAASSCSSGNNFLAQLGLDAA